MSSVSTPPPPLRTAGTVRPALPCRTARGWLGLQGQATWAVRVGWTRAGPNQDHGGPRPLLQQMFDTSRGHFSAISSKENKQENKTTRANMQMTKKSAPGTRSPRTGKMPGLPLPGARQGKRTPGGPGAEGKPGGAQLLVARGRGKNTPRPASLGERTGAGAGRDAGSTAEPGAEGTKSLPSVPRCRSRAEGWSAKSRVQFLTQALPLGPRGGSLSPAVPRHPSWSRALQREQRRPRAATAPPGSDQRRANAIVPPPSASPAPGRVDP